MLCRCKILGTIVQESKEKMTSTLNVTVKKNSLTKIRCLLAQDPGKFANARILTTGMQIIQKLKCITKMSILI